jgi:regulator of RNase E activity RraA
MTHPTYAKYTQVSTCDLADALPRSQFIASPIKPLWPEMPRFAGRAFTVKCAPGDHLMVHVAIYEAQPGDVLVIQADPEFAVSGGNVCAIAQRNGVTGFVVEGVVRDIDEVREIAFPIHGLGICPKPGAKNVYEPNGQPVELQGVTVHTGDINVADNDGVAVIPQHQADEALVIAVKRRDKDAAQTLDEWQANHRANVDKIVAQLTQN